MKKTGFLYVIAVITIIFGILSWPSGKKVKQAQATLSSTNTQIKKYKEQANNITPQDKNFDLQLAEQNGENKVNEGVGLALGGIHSDDDFNKNKDKLVSDLGTKLTKELIGCSQDRNTRKYITSKNDGVVTTFSKMGNPSEANFETYTQFEREDGTKKYVLIEGTYDLKAGKVLTASVSPLSEKPSNHVQSGDEN